MEINKSTAMKLWNDVFGEIQYGHKIVLVHGFIRMILIMLKIIEKDQMVMVNIIIMDGM